MRYCQQCGQLYADGATFCTQDGQPLHPGGLDLEPGTMVGEYQVTRKVGAGAMGDVFAGVHPVIGKRVAIKVLKETLVADQTMVQRFVQEARAVNAIGHPNIIDVFAFGQLPDGRWYFVMELLEGESLEDLLARRAISVDETRRYLEQVCAALGAAHAEGIVHRDLKPGNIFIATPRHGATYVKVLDFGVAKLIRGAEGALSLKTGAPIGTPCYMSPEQVRARRDVDRRSDIYSFGVILFEIFTGRVPFMHPSHFQVLSDHVTELPPVPSSIRPVPPRLESLILRCLAKDPGSRPQSMRDVEVELALVFENEARELRHVLGGESTNRRMAAVGEVVVPQASASGAFESAQSGAHHSSPGPPAEGATSQVATVPRRGLLSSPAWLAALVLAGALLIAGVIFLVRR
ncbi:MAG: serine/threonine protein kinase [Deltaproteobacteria bacterium]|nr:serine/threonine protein kinase [Deltaproteobacteria bacterium]